MKFISAEEFLNQPEEVQKVFLDYFKGKEGIYFNGIGTIKGYGKLFTNLGIIPALTGGQLREFIEDNTKDIVLFDCDDLGDNKNWYIHKTCKAYDVVGNKNLGDDLLQAYWKIAIEIAKCKTRR